MYKAMGLRLCFSSSSPFNLDFLTLAKPQSPFTLDALWNKDPYNQVSVYKEPTDRKAEECHKQPTLTCWRGTRGQQRQASWQRWWGTVMYGGPMWKPGWSCHKQQVFKDSFINAYRPPPPPVIPEPKYQWYFDLAPASGSLYRATQCADWSWYWAMVQLALGVLFSNATVACLVFFPHIDAMCGQKKTGSN